MDPELEKEIADTRAELGDEVENQKPESEKDETPPAEEPNKEPKVEDAPKDEPKDKPQDPPKEAPKTVEAWRVQVMQKKHADEVEELRKQITAAATPPAQPKSPDAPVENEDVVEALAKEFGLEDTQKPLIQKIIDAAVAKVKLPPELEKIKGLLPALEKFQAQAQEAEAERAFTNEFETAVRTLVEAEYPGADGTLLTSVREKLRAKISDSQYQFTPLNLLYKGLDDFRGLIPSKKGAEPTKGSAKRQTEVIDYDSLTPEQYDRLTPAQQEEFATYQIEKERK
jgi:hypothetical protein